MKLSKLMLAYQNWGKKTKQKKKKQAQLNITLERMSRSAGYENALHILYNTHTHTHTHTHFSLWQIQEKCIEHDILHDQIFVANFREAL